MNGGIHLNRNLLKLDYIINIDKFQKIQDDIAEATEMALLTVDYKGTPFTKHSRCSEFCKIVRTHPSYSKLCEKCDSRGGLEAARIQQPYIYICHIGLVDFAIPIIVHGQYIGAVMAGQIRLKDKNEEKKLEKIVNDQYYNINLNFENELRGLYKKLPIMTLEKVKAVANMLFHVCNHIVEEAILKISLNDLNQKFLSLSKHEEVKKVIKEVNNENNCQDDESKIDSKTYKGNIILRPAIEYINNNYNEKLYLDKMASKCNISSSYFSKLFKRETGENFSNYVNKVKVIRAKELLETTDTPIINISLNLGFEDCGYFIKVFKQIEEVTPAVYRKQCK